MNYSSPVLRSLYFRMPLGIRSLAATVYGQLQRRKRYGKVYSEELSALRASQYLSNDVLLKDRDDKTLGFIRMAALEVPYYRKDVYRNVKTVDDINVLPILTKQDLRGVIEQFYNPLCLRDSSWAHTSGTSGRSIIFPLSSYCFQREYAFRAMHYEWGGISLDGRQKVAFCAGHPVAAADRVKPPFWVYDHSNNWLFMSSYHMSDANLAHYIKELESFAPAMIGGYPSSIYLLALANRKYGTGTLKPKAVYCSSETLLEYQQVAIEDSFDTKVYNWYGNSEMCANIVECECGELHMKLEHSYVEILDGENKPCKPGETGRLVCTGFGNSAFPLIRYDMGDVVTLSADQKPRCGRGGIIIRDIKGRIEDYVVTPEGRLVGRLDHLFKDSFGISEAQILQDTPEEITICYVKGANFTENDTNIVLKEARLRLGGNIKVVLKETPGIERTKNGKFKFIISTIPQSEIINKLKEIQ